MIQIYGAGIAGSFLFHLLSNSGYEVSIHDKRSAPDCRCAWGIAYREAKRLYRDIGVNFDDYVLLKPEYVVANGIWLRNKNVVIFDKKQLLEDLWKGLNFDLCDAELKIDATGAARAILPPIEKDRVLPTQQFVEEHGVDENIYIRMERTGYAWAFPLGDDKWHIGAGNVDAYAIPDMIAKLRRMYGFGESNNSCACVAKIRMLQPSKCKPFVFADVAGVGEAIGCVSGAGEGNVPALISAKILFECIENGELNSYEQRILDELWWVEMEQSFVDCLLNGKIVRALMLLPKIISIEKERSVEHSLKDMRRILGI